MTRRYTLRNSDLLKRIMETPGVGVPYSVRALAKAAGCSRGLIEGLISGRQKTASVADAHSIVEALGVALLVLFMPAATPNQDAMTTKDDPTVKE